MKQRSIARAIVAIIVVGALALYGYRRWGGARSSPRDELLLEMPADASAVLFLDLDGLRQSPFLAELYKWAPEPKADPDYAQFLESTGFNYETDLSRVSIAVLKRGQETTLFAVADGRFDRKKISAYASQTGTRESRGGREIFSAPMSGSARRIAFTFLRNNRIALTNDNSLESALSAPRGDSDGQAWRERFRRLAGSPVFAVVRQDAALGAALGAKAPGGLESPQLSALIDQLQWITVAGKPEADRLRVILEGEGTADAPARQLSDVLNGLLVLAEAGLHDQKLRQQLQPGVREAYLEMLKSADVSQIDRGETKSVRLIFDVTPQFLEAARASIPAPSPAPQNKVLPNKSTIRN
ncbi:MAG TPA: hypothetical protein VFF95_13005 [Candidatus Binatus sp.]|jgi:hypothetical protein|nr:hypothetical protein [Verrucomicrobiae bacterium]HZV88460.1 hypothetical protein [Candidatus Binatus sp.]